MTKEQKLIELIISRIPKEEADPVGKAIGDMSTICSNGKMAVKRLMEAVLEKPVRMPSTRIEDQRIFSAFLYNGIETDLCILLDPRSDLWVNHNGVTLTLSGSIGSSWIPATKDQIKDWFSEGKYSTQLGACFENVIVI
jgi:hypothetical protein